MCCCSSLQYILYSALMPHVRLCLLLMFSFCLGISFYLLAAEPFWERVREVQQARQQQSTQSPLFGREDSQSLANDWYCAHPGVPLIIFTKSPSNQSGQVKTLTHRACLLSTWLHFYFFFLSSLFSCQRLCLWPLVTRQAAMKRSSLQLSSQTAMIVLQGRQKIASAFWSGVQ